MADLSPDATGIEYAERIALLHALGEVQSLPRSNPIIETSRTRKTSRTLSIEDEKQLARILAYFSNIDRDPNNVSAVCLQEDGQRLEVLVAANAWKVGESKHLDSVKTGFDTIFELLRDDQSYSSTDVKAKVFAQVISMCRVCILQRSRKTNEKDKPPILEQALGKVSQMEGVENEDLRHYSEDLIKALKDCRSADRSNISTQEDPCSKIVERAYDLSKVPNVKVIFQALGCVKKPNMRPNSRAALFDTIKKLAQYKTYAYNLVRFAGKYSVLRQASVLLVTLDSSAFTPLVIPDPLPDFEATLDKIAGSQKVNWKEKTLKELGRRPKNPREEFKKNLQILEELRIHAEIQLVWYLEEHATQNPPRIIVSHKDACYLCNAFLTLIRGYQTPKTHGRIYPSWRLPATRMSEFQKGFVTDLEYRIVDRVNLLLRTIPSIYPPESTISSNAGSILSVVRVSSRAESNANQNDEPDSGSTTVPNGRRNNSTANMMELKDKESNVSGPANQQTSQKEVLSEQLIKNSGSVLDTTRRSTSLPNIALTSLRETSGWNHVGKGNTWSLQLSNMTLKVEYLTKSSSSILLFKVRRMSEYEAKNPVGDEHSVIPVNGSMEISCGMKCKELRLKVRNEYFLVKLWQVQPVGRDDTQNLEA